MVFTTFASDLLSCLLHLYSLVNLSKSIFSSSASLVVYSQSSTSKFVLVLRIGFKDSNMAGFRYSLVPFRIVTSYSDVMSDVIGRLFHFMYCVVGDYSLFCFPFLMYSNTLLEYLMNKYPKKDCEFVERLQTVDQNF